MRFPASYQEVLAKNLQGRWEDSWRLRIGPQIVLVKVPGKWGRTTVLNDLKARIESADDAPVTVLIRISGREVAGGVGLQAQIMRDLLPGTTEGHRAAERLGVDSAAGKIQFGLGAAGLFAVGFPAALGMFVAGVAAGVAGKIWDDSPVGQAGAVATAARSAAGASTRTPVVVLVDDAESLDVHLAMVALENLVSRSDGQILIVVAASPEGELAWRLSGRDLPPALVPAIRTADASPDMSHDSRARLVRELCPQLPGPVITRIGQRTRTFADIFTVVDAGRLTGLFGEAEIVLPAVERVIDTALARAAPSQEAVIVAWADGLAHPLQAEAGLAITGDAQLGDDPDLVRTESADPDLVRTESLVRLSDPDRTRYAAAVLAMEHVKPTLAGVFLDCALAIQSDAGRGLTDRIVASLAAHRVRGNLAPGSAGPLLAMQRRLVTDLEQARDHLAALDIATESVKGCPGEEDLAEARQQMQAAAFRLGSITAAAGPDPRIADLISQASTDGAAAGIESRVWAAVTLLQAPGDHETALDLISQISADLGPGTDWGPEAAAWRLRLAYHAGRAGHLAASQDVLAPLLASADPEDQVAAVRVMRAIEDPDADTRFQIEALESELPYAGSDDDRLRLHAALAEAYGRIGDYRQAQRHASQELSLRENLQGHEHPDTLTACVNLANWGGQAGHWAAARDMYARLLPVFERVLGPEHLDTLGVRNHLAYWTGRAGDRAAARDMYALLLPVYGPILGPEHPQTLATRGDYANWTGLAGDPATALDMYARLVPVCERVLGPEHRQTLTTRTEDAYWTARTGDPATARDVYARLLPVYERVLGPEHPETLAIRNNLAEWTGQAGDPAAARDMYALLLPVCERVLGPEHPYTLATRRNLANWTDRANTPG
jgi:hypothetical protein